MFESRQGHSIFMLAILFLFCLTAGLQTFAVSQISNFDQFVRFYGKRYKDDEYALLLCVCVDY